MESALVNRFADPVDSSDGANSSLKFWSFCSFLVVSTSIACVILARPWQFLPLHMRNAALIDEKVEQAMPPHEFVSLGFGTVCRSSLEDVRIRPEQGEILVGVSRPSCEHLCSVNERCTGFEFRMGEQRCEMWHQKIFAHRHIFHNRTVPGSPDFECILKSPSCHTLKVQKSLHDLAIMDLSFFLSDYCEYGPTNEKFDACSRFYAEHMYDTSHQLCHHLTKVCRSTTCEGTLTD
ncbi:Apple domain-containing protein [Durusdinium trenchii]|uniref:Apple domain-containing protein n=1 Tax=Durusdinium trenchii TaxID=1381693 RepID=A0ABP0MKL3_9DINO